MKVAILMALTFALVATAAAQNLAPLAGLGTTQTSFISTNGVYSAGGAGFAFPVIPGQNYNYDDIYVANPAIPDVAVATLGGQAANAKTVTKNQDANACCDLGNAAPITVNLERIGLPSQVALASFPGSRATNTVTITTQQK